MSAASLNRLVARLSKGMLPSQHGHPQPLNLDLQALSPRLLELDPFNGRENVHTPRGHPDLKDDAQRLELFRSDF